MFSFHAFLQSLSKEGSRFPKDNLSEYFNPTALKTTKAVWSFGPSERNRVK